MFFFSNRNNFSSENNFWTGDNCHFYAQTSEFDGSVKTMGRTQYLPSLQSHLESFRLQGRHLPASRSQTPSFFLTRQTRAANKATLFDLLELII